MKSQVSGFLALRYLLPRKTFLSFITLATVLGPGFGVWLLIVVISVMGGFQRRITETILDMQPHITLHPSTPQALDDPTPVLARLDALQLPASPFIEGPVLLQVGDTAVPKAIKGFAPETEPRVSRIHERIVAGTFALAPGEALVGADLAFLHGIDLGEYISVHSPHHLNKLFKLNADGVAEQREDAEAYTPVQLKVTGIVKMGHYDFDSSVILVHLDSAAELYGLPWGGATGIRVRAPDPFDLEPLRLKLFQDPAFVDLYPRTWQEANATLFGALPVEKSIQVVLIFGVMVVACMWLVSTLVTVVIQKTREIGVLKALGTPPHQILGIFVILGFAIGGTGTTLGVIAAVLTVHYINKVARLLEWLMGVPVFPPELYKLSQIPADLNAFEVSMIVGAALLVSTLAALLPALYACFLQPAQALRTD
jgi:lipoprotein-releasing system permease protein